MEGSNCGEGGWTRVAYLNMSQPGANCPQGLFTRTEAGLTLCGRTPTNLMAPTPHNGGCHGTAFSTLGLQYSRVCGQIRGYQYGTPDSFHYYSINKILTVDDAYVDGVSITHGSQPRKHIWTYVTGLNLQWSDNSYVCPCNNVSSQVPVPPYVGNDYYCETGDNDKSCCSFTSLYSNDPLWDGQQCIGEEAPCCTNPNMPWFNKTLDKPTSDDIELRVCSYERPDTNEDTRLQIIELFVF